MRMYGNSPYVVMHNFKVWGKPNGRIVVFINIYFSILTIISPVDFNIYPE